MLPSFLPVPTSTVVLLDKGTGLEHLDKNGKTALHHAVHQVKEIFDLIIVQSKTVNIQDHEKRTLLHDLMDITWNSTKRLPRFLIQNGADIQLRDSHGRTVLDLYISNIVGKQSSFPLTDDNILTALQVNGCG
ncbi:hypothetical protein K469DRAFT_777163 [Zopfia rhizophila CBS 207.26]|uniref:Uncharacterized protein n=1 Tax=Zopfia rhizophila CBS 207.26 TaxID=1314779 RepID=A0A6A6E7C4_9PEZI|nr:hypothetical protein K469DRAFT_777163 [Zopfia rhizophila CBS 207.26]